MDMLIADSDSRAGGCYSGIFGGIEGLGEEIMLGELTLDSYGIGLPQPSPREEVPSSDKVVTKAIVADKNTGKRFGTKVRTVKQEAKVMLSDKDNRQTLVLLGLAGIFGYMLWKER